ncbi:YwbE family protein [Sphingobacteriaceae bacterium WQ 2009]|uniref:YwbE family protein n=1 Tax=Rhinopithecimicrobium faecis TaxID=2820698 RepID=A0A8T4HEQ1_9SPHI|nr:YwbE family protein [Sphingobacteriaceae bacterium WQ 2009]
MDGNTRANIKPGMLVAIILKKDQRSGALTEGIVKDLLTSAPYHSRGIKVRLTDGSVGRVSEVIEDDF